MNYMKMHMKASKLKTFPHTEKDYACNLQKKCIYNNQRKTLFPRKSRKSKMATRHQDNIK